MDSTCVVIYRAVTVVSLANELMKRYSFFISSRAHRLRLGLGPLLVRLEVRL